MATGSSDHRGHQARTGEAPPDSEEGATHLSHDEEIDVEERRAPPAKIVHEAIRRQGLEELKRPALSLLWSGLAAGVAMGMSILAEAILTLNLPEGPARPIIASFGYAFGFLIVIMGRLQLFTESTVTAVLPLATQPSWPSFGRTARLWALVLVANLAGTFAFALFTLAGGFGSPEIGGAISAVSRGILGHGFGHVLLSGIPSGFLIAALVWILPSASGERVLIIALLTWLIALGDFAHVVVGSAEAWLLMLEGTMSPLDAVGGYILPAFIGNVIGGTALFALLAHAQVVREIHH
ncbi:formate/nitrite transporter family protein [Stakelama sediminis]|uniref:Formate/nitrite transporter FocA (FNT family) n=1 Tax=Stakelama sediminis TaxID=463200 RepID=A0A840YV34_9SPHN|nr:formate/nitrite transporter family protein [Stakelama sediminis]MBB5717508.1 formate/nitrite transporter FocA (FNT family) [Stakelama sediminis]